MANLKSAIKKIRVDVRRKAHNDTVREEYKAAIRKAKKAGKGKDAIAALSKAYKMIDKAAKNNVIHPNKAGRLKSQVAASQAK